MRYFALAFISFSLISCDSPENRIVASKSKDSTGSVMRASEEAGQDFYTFLERFNQDSVFQMSHIDFPLEGKVANLSDEAFGPETLNDTIEVNEYRIKDFTYDESKADKYDFVQKIQVKGAEAVIEVSGKENGLVIMYTFRKTGGQ